MKRITQKEAVFWILYKRFKEKNFEYVPVHEFMGEVYCEPLHQWGYVSYECSARASEIVKENPGLIQRTTIRGKSGALYYGYRINPEARPHLIQDEKLGAFYRRLVGNKTPATGREQMLKENRERVDQFDREYAREHRQKQA